MAITLTIIPRTRSARELLDSEALLPRLAQTGTQLLGPRYTLAPDIYSDVTSNGGRILLWKTSREEGCFSIRRGRWFLTSTANIAPQLQESIATTPPGLRYKQPVWGRFMAGIGDRTTDRQYFWNTVPTHEAVHYGVDDNFITVSNRPLLCALTMAQGIPAHIQLNENEYLAEYLNFGFSVSGVTPFEKVTTLAPRTALGVHDGNIHTLTPPKEHEIPIQPHENEFYTGTAELKAALLSSTSRYHNMRESNDIQLMLSGGMDSRLLLGLLQQFPDLSIHGITYGKEDSEEIFVAADLASRADIKFSASQAKPVNDSGFIESMMGSIRESQGMIPSESHIAPWASYTEPVTPGRILAAGQWPIFKGATLDRHAKGQTTEFVYRKIRSVDAQIASPDWNEYTQATLNSWMSSVPAMENLDLLYAYSRDIRSSRYLQPHFIQADSKTQVFYPFVDSEVTAVADAMPRRNRIVNVAAFLVMADLWPESTTVPLAHGDRFRFESESPLQGVSGAYWHQRTSAPVKYRGQLQRYPSRDIPPFANFLHNPLTESAKYLVTCGTWSRILRLVGIELGHTISTLSKLDEEEARKIFPGRAAHRMMVVHLWRCILIDQWLQRNWLPTL